MGCCNGVLCFYHDLANVVLWNPATRDAKLVPPPLYCCHPVKKAFYHCLAIGFGFDAKNNDYKVISVQKKGDPLRDWEREFEIEVYSLRTNRWRELQELMGVGQIWCEGVISSSLLMSLTTCSFYHKESLSCCTEMKDHISLCLTLLPEKAQGLSTIMDLARLL